MVVTCLFSGVSAVDLEKSDAWTDAYSIAKICYGETDEWATVYATQYELQIMEEKSDEWASTYARTIANGNTPEWTRAYVSTLASGQSHAGAVIYANIHTAA